MIYRIEFRLEHLPAPIEFDVDLSRLPTPDEVLDCIIAKLKPQEPEPEPEPEPVAGGVDAVREKLMTENGIVAATVFDAKGALLFAL